MKTLKCVFQVFHVNIFVGYVFFPGRQISPLRQPLRHVRSVFSCQCGTFSLTTYEPENDDIRCRNDA